MLAAGLYLDTVASHVIILGLPVPEHVIPFPFGARLALPILACQDTMRQDAKRLRNRRGTTSPSGRGMALADDELAVATMPGTA
jgi:hypothetical protein